MLVRSRKNQARIQRGGDRGSGPPPPWDLSEVGACVEDWWVGEGIQQLFLPYYYQFFSARFARQYYTNIVLVYTYYKLNVQYGTVTISLYSPYPNYDKNPTFNPLLLGIFIFLSRITRFYTILAENFLGEDPQTPHPKHIYNIKSTMTPPPWKQTCMKIIVSKIDLNHSSARWKKSHNPPSPPPFLLLVLFFFLFFFFCLSKFSESWTPPDENSWIRACKQHSALYTVFWFTVIRPDVEVLQATCYNLFDIISNN